MDADDVIPVDKAANLVRHIGRLLQGDHLVAHGDVRRLLLDPVRVPIQERTQKIGHQVHIHLIVVKLLGVQKHVFHAGGGRHDIHVPVIDGPPGGRNIGAPGLVVQGKLGVLIVTKNHQIGQHGHHRQKCHYAAQNQNNCRAAQHSPVGADALLPAGLVFTFPITIRTIGLKFHNATWYQRDLGPCHKWAARKASPPTACIPMCNFM